MSRFNCPNSAAALHPCLRAFTLVELVVVIAIVSLLMAVLMPTLAKARATARLVICQSNLRQFGLASTSYAYENKNLMPDNYCLYKKPGYTNHPNARTLFDYINGSVQTGHSWNDHNTPPCPDVEQAGLSTYGYNDALDDNFRTADVPMRMDAIRKPSLKVTFADLQRGKNPVLSIKWNKYTQLSDWNVTGRHFSTAVINADAMDGRTANVVMVDGHAEFFNIDKLGSANYSGTGKTFFTYFRAEGP